MAARNFWQFVPHPTRKDWYLDPYSGEELSRYKWRQLKAQGGQPVVHPRSNHYQFLLNRYAAEKGISALQARHKPEFHAILANLETISTEASGRKSWALIQLGLREPEWDWAVGETETDVAV